ncbi:MAG: hypothetical protein EP332_10795 [Bacteroidetes bacterium]|nr:MAG: hypothetical protein EP332_10795 [Bacteroidota bacterium]
MKHTVLLSLALIAQSCSIPLTPISTSEKHQARPEIGSVVSVQVGEAIYLDVREKTQEGLRIISIPSFIIRDEKFPYQAGDILPLQAQNENVQFFFKEEDKKEFTSADLQIKFQQAFGLAMSLADNSEVKACYLEWRDAVLRDVFYKKIEGLQVEKVKYSDISCASCYKKELVYSGNSGQSIQLTYREYKGNSQQPALTESLSFDLSKSTFFSFKDLRFEVETYSNTILRCKRLE